MTELTIWAKLDPFRMLQEITAIDPSFIITPYNLLDQSRLAADLSAALGVELTPFDLLDVGAFVQKVEAISGDYVASAVHFDGTVRLSIDALNADDSYDISFSVLLKIADDAYEGNEVLFISDPEGTYGSEVDFWGPGNSNGTTISLDAPGGKFFHNTSSDSKFPAGRWVSLIGSGNTETGVMALYVDRVAASLTLNGNENLPFLMTYSGLKFVIGDDLFGSSFIGDMADLRIMPGVSLLSGSTIPSETLDLFVTEDNKPVDPAVATAALGAPCLLFSGDASSFPINQGTGGAFTLTGTLTDATTSPSDAAAVP